MRVRVRVRLRMRVGVSVSVRVIVGVRGLGCAHLYRDGLVDANPRASPARIVLSVYTLTTGATETTATTSAMGSTLGSS